MDINMLLIFGLPAVALLGMGAWALKRESGGARGAGYLLIALGSLPAMAALAFLLYYAVAIVTRGS